MMGLKNGWLRRRASEGRVNRPLKLCHGVAIIFGDFRRGIAELSSTKVNIPGGVGDLLTGPFFLDEAADVLFDFATLER